MGLLRPYWSILVEEKAQLKFSDFFETKIGMIEPTFELFTQWKSEGREVKYVRCDKGGKILHLKREYTI
jgi:hypothetical protein